MSTYLLLAIAIAFEIAATMGLKASDGFSRVGVTVLVVIGYVCSFALLGLALKQGLEVSVDDGRRFVLRHEPTTGHWELAAVYRAGRSPLRVARLTRP
mgnify:CR=1 FL=1